jgi:hypothetical protein
MTSPKEVSFADYLDYVFGSPIWLDTCVSMLSVFVGNIDRCRDNPARDLPDLAPAVLEQVEAVNERAKRLEKHFRELAEKRPEFKTGELGAILWWAGMAEHKATSAIESSREKMERKDWDEAFFEIHAGMFDTVSALSLLYVADGMIGRMESEGRPETDRPN